MKRVTAVIQRLDNFSLRENNGQKLAELVTAEDRLLYALCQLLTDDEEKRNKRDCKSRKRHIWQERGILELMMILRRFERSSVKTLGESNSFMSAPGLSKP